MSAMNADDDSDGVPENFIDQSQEVIAKARETLVRAELLVARAQANRQKSLDVSGELDDRTTLMASLQAMQGARAELVMAIQQTTQAMHHTTRFVQAREKLIQERVEWKRKYGK